ncbi:MAG: hypothetical protein FJW88_06070 [Actinobacteria bacterium]|nr:hypothetical protein [Actinomycetota bacterium]
MWVTGPWPRGLEAAWNRSRSGGWARRSTDPGGSYDQIHRLAFDEAIAAGVIDPELGLPHRSAKNAIDGFKRLVDAGCIGVSGTAFMSYFSGFDKFEGWVGIDQWCPDNQLSWPLHERYVARYGEDPPRCGPTRSPCSPATRRGS